MVDVLLTNEYFYTNHYILNKFIHTKQGIFSLISILHMLTANLISLSNHKTVCFLVVVVQSFQTRFQLPTLGAAMCICEVSHLSSKALRSLEMAKCWGGDGVPLVWKNFMW